MKDASIGNSGASVIEIIIAMAILVLNFTAIILLVFGNQSQAVDAANSEEALNLGRVFLEEQRVLARQDFNKAANTTTAVDIYQKSLLVNDVSACLKQATARVSWNAEHGRDLTVDLGSEFSSPAAARALGDDCLSSPLKSDWDAPTPYASDSPGSPPTTTAIDTLQKIVYMGGREAPFLHIADARNAALGQTSGLFVSFANGFNPGARINDIDAAARRDAVTGARKIYAYAARHTNNSQFQVIDVTDIANPNSTPAMVKLLNGVQALGSYPQGRQIFYFKDRVYITTRETAGPEFHVFNVGNPLNPAELGPGYELNHTVNDMVVAEASISGTPHRLAYLATTANDRELMILDVTNPASIVEIWNSNHDLPGSNDAESIFLLGNRIYLGRQSSAGADFYIFDASRPEFGAFQMGSADIGTSVIGLRVSENLAFLAAEKNGEEFQVWDVSNPAAMTNVSKIAVPDVVEGGLDYEDNFIYLATRSNPALQIIYNP